MASQAWKSVSTRGDINSGASLTLTVASGHVYLIKSFIITEQAGQTNETVDVYIDDGGGGADTYIYQDFAIGAKETFIHNDTLALEAADHITFTSGATCDFDVFVSYLDITL